MNVPLRRRGFFELSGTATVMVGDALTVLRQLPTGSHHCCITSPPYFGLRNYGVVGQIGLEDTPAAYVQRIVEVMREVRRVLRDDGILWLNLGDSYASQGGAHGNRDDNQRGVGAKRVHESGGGDQSGRAPPTGIKAKDLMGIPWRVAFALQEDGWYLRSDIIWAKANPVPESILDRCTSAHEHVFMLTKRARYFYDYVAMQEQSKAQEGTRAVYSPARAIAMGREPSGNEKPGAQAFNSGVRNMRDVWTINTQAFSGSHFATFPPELVRRCVKAGTSEHGCCPRCGAPWVRILETTPDTRTPYATIGTGPKAAVIRTDGRQNRNKVLREDGTGGDLATKQRTTIGWQPSCTCNAGDPVPCTVLDPFGGAGTTGLVAGLLARHATLIELNPTYAEMARKRIHQDDVPVEVVAPRRRRRLEGT